MNKKSLHELGLEHNTDKADLHNFCDFYDKHLSSLREEPLKILEIGIYEGASLRMWGDYFENSQVYGIDILQHPCCVLLNEKNITSKIVDQGSEQQLLDFVAEFGPFDIIIDDGSHLTEHQLLSYKLFADKTPIFIWEDLHTSNIARYVTTPKDEELPLDIARRRAKEEDNCFLFEKENPPGTWFGNSITFLIDSRELLKK